MCLQIRLCLNSAGVPTGSVLGVILFLIHILPLGQIIQQFLDVSYHPLADDIQPYRF